MLKSLCPCMLLILVMTGCSGSTPRPAATVQPPPAKPTATIQPPKAEPTVAGFAVILEEVEAVEVHESGSPGAPRTYRSFKLTNSTDAYQAVVLHSKCRDADGALVGDVWKGALPATGSAAAEYYVVPPNGFILVQNRLMAGERSCKWSVEVARTTPWDSRVMPLIKTTKVTPDSVDLQYVFKNPGPDLNNWEHATVRGYDAQGKLVYGEQVKTRVEAPAGETVKRSLRTVNPWNEWDDPKIDRWEIDLIIGLGDGVKP